MMATLIFFGALAGSVGPWKVAGVSTRVASFDGSAANAVAAAANVTTAVTTAPPIRRPPIMSFRLMDISLHFEL
jgi:hypothetical protein